MSNIVKDEVFAASPEGFRAQNLDRPAAHLVRELIQNALDEDKVTTLDVEVTYHGSYKGTTVKVTDDSAEGIRAPKLIFTLWLSDKEDSPNKRGRMGRGLKELVSVSDETTVRSCSIDAIVFKRFKGGEWERRSVPKLGKPLKGTEVTAFCRGWGKKDASSIVQFLHRVRAPSTVQMRVSFRDASEKCLTCAGTGQVQDTPCGVCNSTGQLGTGLVQIAPFRATETYNTYLPTVIYEVDEGERKARDRSRHTDVQCFSPPPGEKAWVYEMGIPVEQCDSPVSIDVQQRVILRERRDTLTESYRRELFAKVLSARINKLTDAELRDNATLTAAAGYGLSPEAKARIAMVWTDGKPFAASPETRSQATGHHIEVVNLRSLPEAIRGIVREVGIDVKGVLESRKGEFCPEVSAADLTTTESRTVHFFEWVAKGIGRPCRVLVRKGRVASADFCREKNELSLYRDVLRKQFFADPASPGTLRILVHECSHWRIPPSSDEHGSEFAHDNDYVGGCVASYLLQNAEQARLLLKGGAP